MIRITVGIYNFFLIVKILRYCNLKFIFLIRYEKYNGCDCVEFEINSRKKRSCIIFLFLIIFIRSFAFYKK